MGQETEILKNDVKNWLAWHGRQLSFKSFMPIEEIHFFPDFIVLQVEHVALIDFSDIFVQAFAPVMVDLDRIFCRAFFVAGVGDEFFKFVDHRHSPSHSQPFQFAEYMVMVHFHRLVRRIQHLLADVAYCVP